MQFRMPEQICRLSRFTYNQNYFIQRVLTNSGKKTNFFWKSCILDRNAFLWLHLSPPGV